MISRKCFTVRLFYFTESTSESDGSEEFYPMDLKSRQQKRKTSNDQRLQPSKMCLTLNIGKGSLTAYAPLKVKLKFSWHCINE